MADEPHVLLVEDNPNDVELTLAALANTLANEVVVVRDGAEALDYLYREGEYASRSGDDPILVLLDLKLPKVDGIEVLEQVKADPHLRRIPVVMLTSSNEKRDVQRSYVTRANAYVVKPIEFGEFVKKVGEVGFFWTIVNESPPQGCEDD